MRIDGTSALGPIGEDWEGSGEKNVTTVRLGESFLSDVAHRVGVESDSLRKANPHLSETAKLTPGQEIRLPRRAARGDDDSEANSEKVR
ncbi:MAG TPA: LysM peptidoglycan-binding domain-containing protein [Terriglobales bacterium]|nr:LysM peptidoglycan-binding domain-containing protein [Terriglobales bacterium]